jgi:Zn-dependent protease with chaperone function
VATPAVKPSAKAGPTELSRDAATKQILAGLGAPIKRTRTPVAYQLAAIAVALLMMLLPVVYLGLIGLLGYGVYWHAVNDTGLLTAPTGHDRNSGKAAVMAFLVYLAPIIGGAVAIVFMIKPLFARPQGATRLRSLRRESDPVLFSFVDRICETVGAPRPKRIDLDCQVNASASFRRGLISMIGNDLVLTIGLPLVAGLNTRQLAGVLAHEFGHFSQGFGMRLTYIIRSMNHWLMRVVYQRDRADAWLTETASSIDIRFGWVLYLAMLCVWISRRVLWVLMYVGHFFGSHLLRQMEFDADRHEVRLAGSAAFKQTARQLHLLNYASEGAFHDLRELYREERLVDDLPRLIMVQARDAPPNIMEQVDKVIAESKTGWFDTHPSDADRVAAAEREGGEGVFALELPASLLFSDYVEQCKATTWDFYRGIFGEKVKRAQMRPVEEIEARHAQAKQGEAALERFFQGEWHTAAPMPVGGIYLALPLEPKASLAALQRVRAEMVAMAPKVRGFVKKMNDAHKKLCEAQHLHDWVRAKGKVPKETLKKWGGAEGLERSAKALELEFEKAVARMQPYNALAARRLLLALELAHVDKVRGRIAAPIDEQELQRSFATLQILSEQVATLAKVYPRHAAMGRLLESLTPGGNNESAVAIIRDLMKKLLPPAQHMRTAFARCAYPYDHERGQVTLSQYLMPEVPQADDVGSIYNGIGQALELAPPLYVRVLGQLVDAAVAVETACGFPPQADPPKDDADNAAKGSAASSTAALV